MDATGIALILTAFGTITTPIVVAYFALVAKRDLLRESNKNLVATADVHDEVKTHNGMTSGDTLDAVFSQGIAAKAPGERTDTDLSHQAHMAANDPSGVVAADQAAAAEREKP